MRIGIDATNLRSGGSLTHIGELMAAARPEEHGITRVVLWAGREVLDRLPARPWLEAVHAPALDRPLPFRMFWQQTRLASLAHRAAVDLLFIPGGTYLGRFRPFVTMSRNMLPFDPSQMRLFGPSLRFIKFLLLRMGQSATFREANGMIFLHEYALSRITPAIRPPSGREAVIPHGVSGRFRLAPRVQRPLDTYSAEHPFKLLYVSTVDEYKHQWRVAEAVARLVAEGLPVTLELVGDAHPESMRRLRRAIDRLHAKEFVHYRGHIPYDQLPEVYGECDGFVFASTCENLPNCLLEAMTSGLPIACSEKAPMPRILGDGGVYFDSSKTDDIVRALRHLVSSPEARVGYAAAAHARAEEYTWERCANETFSFLRAIA